MKLRSKRPAAALLAAILVLGLVGCDSGGKEVHKVNWVTAPAYLAEDNEGTDMEQWGRGASDVDIRAGRQLLMGAVLSGPADLIQRRVTLYVNENR